MNSAQFCVNRRAVGDIKAGQVKLPAPLSIRAYVLRQDIIPPAIPGQGLMPIACIGSPSVITT